MIRRVILLAALSLALPGRADDIAWPTQGKPLDICYAAQKNVRFLFNAWANGATDTFRDLKAHLRRTLGDKGPAEARLLAVYEEIIPRIEANEFLPPNVESRVAGATRAQQLTGSLCLKAFDGR